ncbi:hypothetical protein A6A19_04930 [Actinobacillus delphinicola]|uniref:Uncharacterized conserved protein n=1 Tax=Actinobacillus delphinicola TaxID=51161 RepID=A0A448TTF2_9PAST|nr:DUF302 domain-containing protein [Actinobacillus delphinicola]MDG6897351.1 hypothetical protein [Actinobacillus delphinicola]VEJ09175.1 Uncharacterized conserved protein [Actinobacillus delphinicola]
MLKIKFYLPFFVLFLSTGAFAMPPAGANPPQSTNFYVSTFSSSYIESVTQGDKVTKQGEATVANMLCSKYNFDTTISRLKKAFADKNLPLLKQVDNPVSTKESGVHRSVTLMFGNLQSKIAQSPFFALNLPLKIVVTQTDFGVKVSFNSTQSLVKKNKLTQQDVVNNLIKAEMLITKTITQ